jgi:hypothetical protein
MMAYGRGYEFHELKPATLTIAIAVYKCLLIM